MQPLKKCGKCKLKNAGISNTAGMNKRLYHSPHSKILNVKTYSFFNYSILFSFTIKQVYSPSPFGIDSALLFTRVKKQMAITYLMLGGGEGGSRFMLVQFCVYFLCRRLVFYLPSSFSACLFSPSPSLSQLSSASSQPHCRQEVRPCHSALPAVSAGSPSQITLPTVQYLKKSSIVFV